jgi:hypothetical protein
MVALVQQQDLVLRLDDVHRIQAKKDRARHAIGPAARNGRELRLARQRIGIELLQ